MSLTVRILIGMAAGLLVGTLVQVAAGGPPPVDSALRAFLVDGVFYVFGAIFIQSLKLLVVPLVLVSLVCGASNLSDGAAMGRIGGKALVLYVMTTAIAVTLAMAVALIVAPGAGVEFQGTVEYEPGAAPSFVQVLINIFPDNPIAAMAEGNMLQVIVFALLLGVALAWSGEPGQRVKALFEDLNAVIMRLITMLIALTPYGVFFLMARLGSTVGLAEIVSLAKYFFTVAGVLVLHAAVVYPTLLLLFARLSPLRFYSKIRNVMLVAFSTSSSGATLPVTLRTVEERLGVHNEAASFTVPLGATINMDGTAIMQGVATVFIAQFYGVDLTGAQMMMVVLTATMASIGTAGVPGVGLIMLTMVLGQVGLPTEGIMLIIGVDRLLDMMRTAVNVSGDAMVATIVARSEGRFDEDVFNDPDAGVVESVRPTA